MRETKRRRDGETKWPESNGLKTWSRGSVLARSALKSTESRGRFRATSGSGWFPRCDGPAFPSRRTLPKGSDGRRRLDLVRYLRMARGSLFEVQTQALIAVDLGFMTEAELPSELIAECDRVLQALIRSLEERV